MRLGGGKGWREAISRHLATLAATSPRTAWRFKSSHPHSRFKPNAGTEEQTIWGRPATTRKARTSSTIRA